MTGLIYVVIIGLWAAVLIPIWLKRQDQVSEVRSTARFSSAMRSLGDRADTKSGKSETHVRDFTSPRDRARAQAAKRRSLILAALDFAVIIKHVTCVCLPVTPTHALICMASVAPARPPVPNALLCLQLSAASI